MVIFVGSGFGVIMPGKNNIPEGHGRILDAWEPPNDAGDPIGCIATTFTFSPDFFEEECLGRFLKLETDAFEDRPLYLIEREEKLAQVVCAAVIVDQHFCKGARSLRWDLHPARPGQGILHAKIALLCWSRMVRIIIASANLTKDGYRRNREVYGVLDYHENSKVPLGILHEVIAFLRENLNLSLAEAESPSLKRAVDFLGRIGPMSRNWGIEPGGESNEFLRVAPLLTGPGRPTLFDQISANWPGGAPPHSAWVLSPFFDPPEAKTNAPAGALWNIMRKKGDATVDYCLEVEPASEKGRLFVKAPESLLTTRPSRASCSVQFSKVAADKGRPLHAKELWLQDDRWVLLLIGSSNFTSSGTGIGKAANYEANLAYLLDMNRAPRGWSTDLNKRFPAIESIDNPEGCLTFQQISEPDADTPGEGVLLPTGFLSATYRRVNDERGEVTLDLGDDLPPSWRVMDEEEVPLLTEREWRPAGCPKAYRLDWRKKPPSGLWVTWKSAEGNAWWPVNTASSADLPPPDHLRDLPLDVLIDILTSARPLHEAIRGYLRRKGDTKNGRSTKSGVELDPHKKVDTSGFLLQRTRRFSWALAGLRARLERPAPTTESLDWRIYGPVGVMAVANALAQEAKSQDERVFLLAELTLEILRTRPQAAQGSLPVSEVRKALHDVAVELATRFSLPNENQVGSLGRYLKNVLKRVEE